LATPDKIVWRSGDRVYVPSLELIEARGEKFKALTYRQTWSVEAVRWAFEPRRSRGLPMAHAVVSGVQYLPNPDRLPSRARWRAVVWAYLVSGVLVGAEHRQSSPNCSYRVSEGTTLPDQPQIELSRFCAMAEFRAIDHSRENPLRRGVRQLSCWFTVPVGAGHAGNQSSTT
jgi:hypothetical protein